MSSVRASLLVCIAVLVSACGGGADSDSPKAPAADAAVPPAASSAGNATVSGMAPAAKSGVPAIVILKSVQPQDVPPQSAPPVMDQIQLEFTPTILFARPGQPAEFRNSDDQLHNIRVLEESTKEPAFNIALPTGGAYKHTFEKEGFYDVGCDIHPGMSAVVVAANTPFMSIAAQDGQFVFSNVPPGDYTLTVYAGAKKYERVVTVQAGTVDVGAVAG
ncbi:MAG: hypothetical protein AB7O32_09025 [Vicinamibacterales bacterium]